MATNDGAVSAGVHALAVPERPVQRSLLGNQIAESLRRDILLGNLKPGTKISQQGLCERFGTSRMPVRDGLRALAHEGLVITDAGRHTIVAPLSRQDLLDAYIIEGTLGGLAAERASQKAGPEQLEALTGLHDAMIEAIAAGDQRDVAELNWRIHRDINRLAASRKIAAAIKFVSLDLPRNFLVEQSSWNERSVREHEEIFEAMRKGQHAKVRKLMTEHIVSSGEKLIDYLEAEGLALES